MRTAAAALAAAAWLVATSAVPAQVDRADPAGRATSADAAERGAAGQPPIASSLVPDLAREFAVRDAARDLPTARAGLQTADARDWLSLSSALDALARAVEVDGSSAVGPLPPELLRAVDHAHPNVRAAALRAASLVPAWASALLASDERVRALGGDPLPEVRTHLARAFAAGLEADLTIGGAAALAERLLGDVDSTTTAAAQHLLVAALGVGPGGAGPNGADPNDSGAHGSDSLRAAAALLGGQLREQWAADERFKALGLLDALEVAAAPPEALTALARELDGELRTVVEALGLIAGAPGDAESIAARWPRRFGDRARAESILWRAVRASGDARPWLIVALERDDTDLARAVAYGLGTEPLLELALAADGEDAVVLLEALGESVDRWSAEDVERLLAGDAPPAAVIDAVARAVLEEDPAASAALAAGLAGLPPGLRERGLRLLGAEAIAGNSEAIFAAWELEDRPLGWIDRLPRERPSPSFRLALLEFGADRELRARVAGPLAAFRGDPVVLDILTGWLDEELETLEVAPRRESTAVAEALAAALARAGGAATTEVLSGAIARTRSTAPDLAASIARRLGAVPEARPLLAAGVDRALSGPGGWSDGVLDEALIALAASAPSTEAIDLLATRLAGMRDDRQLRAFAALRLLGADAPVPALAGLAFDRGRAIGLRLRAVDAMGAAGAAAVGPLAELFRTERDFEVRAATIRALGAIGGETVTLVLRGLRLELSGAARGFDFAEPAVEEGRQLLDEELRIELARGGAPELEADGGFLSALVADAAQDLIARFERDPLAAVEFRWRVELRTAASLARSDGLAAALGASGPWQRADGRALLALANVVDGTSPARLDLARAGLVALVGEGSATSGLAERARLSALQLELALDDWAAVARRAGILRRSRIAGTASEGAWAGSLGTAHPATGRDPLAWLAALELQAGAFAALAEGDRDGARALADRAAARLGCSEAARSIQAALEASLAR